MLRFPNLAFVLLLAVISLWLVSANDKSQNYLPRQATRAEVVERQAKRLHRRTVACASAQVP